MCGYSFLRILGEIEGHYTEYLEWCFPELHPVIKLPAHYGFFAYRSVYLWYIAGLGSGRLVILQRSFPRCDDRR